MALDELCGCLAAVDKKTRGRRRGILALHVLAVGRNLQEAQENLNNDGNVFSDPQEAFVPLRLGQIYREDPRARPYLNQKLGKPHRHGVNDAIQHI